MLMIDDVVIQPEGTQDSDHNDFGDYETADYDDQYETNEDY